MQDYPLLLSDIREIKDYVQSLFKGDTYYDCICITISHGSRYEIKKQVYLNESNVYLWAEAFNNDIGEARPFTISISVWAGCVFCKFPSMYSDYDKKDILDALKVSHEAYIDHLNKSICSLVWKKISSLYQSMCDYIHFL